MSNNTPVSSCTVLLDVLKLPDFAPDLPRAMAMQVAVQPQTGVETSRSVAAEFTAAATLSGGAAHWGCWTLPVAGRWVDRVIGSACRQVAEARSCRHLHRRICGRPARDLCWVTASHFQRFRCLTGGTIPHHFHDNRTSLFLRGTGARVRARGWAGGWVCEGEGAPQLPRSLTRLSKARSEEASFKRMLSICQRHRASQSSHKPIRQINCRGCSMRSD